MGEELHMHNMPKPRRNPENHDDHKQFLWECEVDRVMCQGGCYH